MMGAIAVAEAKIEAQDRRRKEEARRRHKDRGRLHINRGRLNVNGLWINNLRLASSLSIHYRWRGLDIHWRWGSVVSRSINRRRFEGPGDDLCGHEASENFSCGGPFAVAGGGGLHTKSGHGHESQNCDKLFHICLSFATRFFAGRVLLETLDPGGCVLFRTSVSLVSAMSCYE
jgi:hypothetical protein